MKANVQLEIGKDELQYELKELVEETAKEEIVNMIKSFAKPLIETEVKKYVEPLALEVLTTQKLDFHNGAFGIYSSVSEQETNGQIKAAIKKVLGTPSWRYSQTAKNPFEKYHTSSSPHEDKPLINHIVNDMIREYITEELMPEIKNMVKETVTDIKKVKEIMNEKIREILMETSK